MKTTISRRCNAWDNKSPFEFESIRAAVVVSLLEYEDFSLKLVPWLPCWTWKSDEHALGFRLNSLFLHELIMLFL